MNFDTNCVTPGALSSARRKAVFAACGRACRSRSRRSEFSRRGCRPEGPAVPSASLCRVSTASRRSMPAGGRRSDPHGYHRKPHPLAHCSRGEESHAPKSARSPVHRHPACRDRRRRRATPSRGGFPCPDLAELGERSPDLARREHDRLHGDLGGLGEQPVRPGDMGGRSRRRALPAHPHRIREQQWTPVVAGRIPPRLHREPRRRRADLPDPPAGRRGGTAYLPRRGDQLLSFFT